jgi:hypothetical protein
VSTGRYNERYQSESALPPCLFDQTAIDALVANHSAPAGENLWGSASPFAQVLLERRGPSRGAFTTQQLPHMAGTPRGGH